LYLKDFSVSVKELTTPLRRFVTERAYDIASPTRPVKIDTHIYTHIPHILELLNT